MPNAAITINPWEDFATVMRHADKARATGDAARAHTFYARALQLNPNDARAWAGYAATASHPHTALVSWGYARALRPDDPEASAELERLVTEIVSQKEATATTLVALGRALAAAGQKRAAYRLLARATDLAPAHVEAWLWRAGVSEDAAEMLACLQRALALEPHNARAQAGLQWARSRQTRAPVSPTAVAEAAQLLEEGQRALQAGDHARAHDLFRHATERDPRNEHAWFWRGSTASNVDDQLACMEQALAINPHNLTARETQWWLRVKKWRVRAQALARSVPKKQSRG